MPVPVSVEAVEGLLDAVGNCLDVPVRPSPHEIIDVVATAREVRRFKVDVSFSLQRSGRESARFSVNDTGEPKQFRDRLRRSAGALGLPLPEIERFLEISPAGIAQTTLGVKWGAAGGAPERVTLYHEELYQHPAPAAVFASAFRLLPGSPVANPWPSLVPGAVAADYAGGRIVALKDYWIATERSDVPAADLPASLERFRLQFPLDPIRGTRRYLVARRFAANGVLCGHKLLWMSEAHDRSAAQRAWDVADRLRRTLSIPNSRSSAALDALRSGWQHEAYLYPDLISIDVDSNGEPTGLVLYVSIK